MRRIWRRKANFITITKKNKTRNAKHRTNRYMRARPQEQPVSSCVSPFVVQRRTARRCCNAHGARWQPATPTAITSALEEATSRSTGRTSPQAMVLPRKGKLPRQMVLPRRRHQLQNGGSPVRGAHRIAIASAIQFHRDSCFVDNVIKNRTERLKYTAPKTCRVRYIRRYHKHAWRKEKTTYIVTGKGTANVA